MLISDWSLVIGESFDRMTERLSENGIYVQVTGRARRSGPYMLDDAAFFPRDDDRRFFALDNRQESKVERLATMYGGINHTRYEYKTVIARNRPGYTSNGVPVTFDADLERLDAWRKFLPQVPALWTMPSVPHAVDIDPPRPPRGRRALMSSTSPDALLCR